MRILKDAGSLFISNLNDASITQTNEQVTLVVVHRNGVTLGHMGQERQSVSINLLFKLKVAIWQNLNNGDLSIFGATKKLVALCAESGNGVRVSFNTPHYGIIEAPNLNLAIITTSVAPTLIVEFGTCKHTLSKLSSKGTHLLETFSHISWVPELNLLRALKAEPQIIRALRPGTEIHF